MKNYKGGGKIFNKKKVNISEIDRGTLPYLRRNSFQQQLSNQRLALRKQGFPVRVRSLPIWRRELSAVIILANVEVLVKRLEVVKMSYPWCCPSHAVPCFVNVQRKKTQIEQEKFLLQRTTSQMWQISWFYNI